jgi:PAB1-binding protein PBP1
MSIAYFALRIQFSASECLLPYFGKLPCNLLSTVTAMAQNFSWGRLQQCLDGNGTIRSASPNNGSAEHQYGSARNHGTNT